jgi:hypothetical protein
MRAPRAPAWAGAVVLCLLWGAAAHAQVWFDALLARVDGQPILASDVTLEDMLFGEGRTFSEMAPDAREAILTRLIQRRLLLAEAERFGVAEPAAGNVGAAVERLRQRAGARLEGLDPDTVRARVRARLWAEAFVDARIRAFVFVRDAQVEPRVRQWADSLPTPPDAVARAEMEARVRGELARREAARRLEKYLARLESRATIRRYPLPDAGALAPDPARTAAGG